MKAIQITMDERLLKVLDKRTEVRKLGRSAVVREAVYAWLHSKREREIGEQYRRAYTDHPPTEFAEWVKEPGAWPEP